jgi:predicted amino acid-binding ACT domain protein
MASVAVNAVSSGSLWSKVKSVPARYPFAFGVVLSGFKTSASDLLVQKVVERREKVDWKRNSAFAAFGFIYLGGVQYSIYVNLFSKMFPRAAAFAAAPLREKVKDAKGMFSLGAQVFLDQCVHHPLMYFPAFYCTKELVMSDKPDFPKVLSKYRENLAEDLAALWKIWVPATIFNFAFMPMYARIPFVAGVSLLWTCVLSAMRGGDVGHSDDVAGGAVTGATLKIFEEGLQEYFTCPVELDKNLSHIVVTASGPDKVGWVAMLARNVAAEGGNVTFSKMVRLGQEFIILMHVAVPPEQKDTLLKSLKRNKDLKPLNIRTTGLSRRETGKYDKPTTGLRIHCVGEDK